MRSPYAGGTVAATLAPVLTALAALILGLPWPVAALGGVVAALLGAAWLARSQRAEVERVGARASGEARIERRAAEAERDRLATLIAELGDAILIIDMRDQVRLANPAAERLLGVAPLVGRRVAEVIRDHEILTIITRSRRESEVSGQVERSQPQRLLRVVARALDDGDLLLAIQDLSALRRLETVRADFVANVSHELRTPIASLKAIAETLQSGAIDDPEAARDFVGRMLQETDGLAQLVEELLSLARIESGATALVLRPTDPLQLLRDAADRMRPLAERAGVAIQVDPAGSPPAIPVDPEKIGQVLTNLLHNAVKFTPSGGTIRLHVGAGSEGMVEISVGDDGSGIDPADLERIFERFYKGDRSRATGGTGLGLAIARHIVRAHGGELRAASDGPGRGSRFSFTLPAGT